MKEWLEKFINEHGPRLFYGALSLCFAVGFIMYQPDGEIGAAGRTILIGLAMLCYNKSRGNGNAK